MDCRYDDNSVYKVVYCAYFAGMDWKQYVKEVVFRSVISYALPILASIGITAFFSSSFLRLIIVLIVSTLTSCGMFYLCGLNAMEKAEVNKLKIESDDNNNFIWWLRQPDVYICHGACDVIAQQCTYGV